MEDDDYRLEVQCARYRRAERIKANIALFSVLGVLASPAVALYTKEKIEAKKASVLKEQSATAKADRKMLSSAYSGDVDNLEKALKEGADIKALNHEGKNLFMIAVSNPRLRNYQTARYILDNPELAQQIDYKQVDNNGETVLDILEHHIAKDPQPWMQILKEKINENLEIQNSQERAGQARSSTCYDFYNQSPERR